MRVTMQNANIRGYERRSNKAGDPYLLIHVEDSAGASTELVDKKMERASLYIRNTDVDIDLDISVGRYTTIRISDVRVIKKP